MNLFAVKTVEKISRNIQVEVQEIIVLFACIQSILIKSFLEIEQVIVFDL